MNYQRIQTNKGISHLGTSLEYDLNIIQNQLKKDNESEKLKPLLKTIYNLKRDIISLIPYRNHLEHHSTNSIKNRLPKSYLNIHHQEELTDEQLLSSLKTIDMDQMSYTQMFLSKKQMSISLKRRIKLIISKYKELIFLLNYKIEQLQYSVN